jgi:hypothetical protein
MGDEIKEGDEIINTIYYIVNGGDPDNPEDARDLKTPQGKINALLSFSEELEKETPADIYNEHLKTFKKEIEKLIKIKKKVKKKVKKFKSSKVGKYLSVHDLLAADTAKIKNWTGDEGEEDDEGEDQVVLTIKDGKKLAGGKKKSKTRKKRRKKRRKTKRRRKRRKTRKRRRKKRTR